MRVSQVPVLLVALITATVCFTPAHAADPLDQARAQFSDESFEQVIQLLEPLGSDALGVAGQRLLGLSYFEMGDAGRSAPLLQSVLDQDAADAEVLAALTDIHLSRNDNRRALQTAQQLSGAVPGDASDLVLAGALNANGDQAQAERLWRRLSGAQQTRIAQQAGLAYAQSLADRGDVAGARAAAQAALERRSSSFAGRELQALLNNLEAPQASNDELLIALGVRLDYDDNVLLLPDDPSNVIIATDESDTRINLLADIIYRRSLQQNLSFFAEAHFRHGELNDLSEFSTSELRGVVGLGGSYDRWGWRLPLEVGKQWIDSDGFRDSVVLTPGAYYRFSNQDLLFGYLRLQEDDFDGFDLRQADDPSGDRTGIGVMYLVALPASASELRLIGEFTEVDADGRNVARDEARLYGYYTWNFAERWQAGVGAQYLQADYDNVHNVFLRQREDDTFDLFAHLAYELDRHWEIRGQFTTGERDSNIDAFGYERTVFSVGINWKN